MKVVNSRCGKTSQHYCSHLWVSHSQARHTGLYRCRYKHQTQKQQSVYVYVTGKTEGVHDFIFSSFPPSQGNPSPPLAYCVFPQVKQDVVCAKYRPMPENQLYLNTVCLNNTSSELALAQFHSIPPRPLLSPDSYI